MHFVTITKQEKWKEKKNGHKKKTTTTKRIRLTNDKLNENSEEKRGVGLLRRGSNKQYKMKYCGKQKYPSDDQ